MTYTLSVKVPPRIGPTTDEIPNSNPNIELMIGRFAGGTSGIVSSIAPEKMKADANPAIARPRMKAVELGAAPQSTEPTSKMIIEERKTHFVEYS